MSGKYLTQLSHWLSDKMRGSDKPIPTFGEPLANRPIADIINDTLNDIHEKTAADIIDGMGEWKRDRATMIGSPAGKGRLVQPVREVGHVGDAKIFVPGKESFPELTQGHQGTPQGIYRDQDVLEHVSPYRQRVTALHAADFIREALGIPPQKIGFALHTQADPPVLTLTATVMIDMFISFGFQDEEVQGALTKETSPGNMEFELQEALDLCNEDLIGFLSCAIQTMHEIMPEKGWYHAQYDMAIPSHCLMKSAAPFTIPMGARLQIGDPWADVICKWDKVLSDNVFDQRNLKIKKCDYRFPMSYWLAQQIDFVTTGPYDD